MMPKTWQVEGTDGTIDEVGLLWRLKREVRSALDRRHHGEAISLALPLAAWSFPLMHLLVRNQNVGLPAAAAAPRDTTANKKQTCGPLRGQ